MYFSYIFRKRHIPFRPTQELTPAGLAATDEQLDSVTRHHIINELRRTTGTTHEINGKISSTIGMCVTNSVFTTQYTDQFIVVSFYQIDNNDLLVTMASRLGQVERELLSARKEIIEKDHHIR